jgi:hypothetical protein
MARGLLLARSVRTKSTPRHEAAPRTRRARRASVAATALFAAVFFTSNHRAANVAHAQNAQPQPDPQFQVLFVPTMVRNVCVGDEVLLRFSATQTNAPDELASLVPPSRRAEPAPGQETFAIEATGGTVTPSRAQLFGTSEVFTVRFRAARAGAASVTVRPVRGSGAATKSFNVQQLCDYRVEALGRAIIAQQHVRVEEVFIARGTLNRSRRGDTQGGGERTLAGDGTVWVRADMSGSAGPVACTMDPMIAHGSFQTNGTLADDAVEFSFNFGSINFEHGFVFHCRGPNNMRLDMPLNTGTQGGDATRLGLRDLVMGPWGGSMSFSYGPSTGVVTLTLQGSP